MFEVTRVFLQQLPLLAGFSVLIQPHLQSPSGLANIDLLTIIGDMIYHIELLIQRQCTLDAGQLEFQVS